MAIEPRSLIGRFVSFDTLIGAPLVRLVYLAGVAVIVLYALVLFFAGLNAMRFSFAVGFGGIVGAVATLLLGIVGWRLTCELCMVLFRIHDLLREQRDRAVPPPAE